MDLGTEPRPVWVEGAAHRTQVLGSTQRMSPHMKREIDVANETKEERIKRELDLELDRELENTFPASDAPKITRRAAAFKEAADRPDPEPDPGLKKKT